MDYVTEDFKPERRKKKREDQLEEALSSITEDIHKARRVNRDPAVRKILNRVADQLTNQSRFGSP